MAELGQVYTDLLQRSLSKHLLAGLKNLEGRTTASKSLAEGMCLPSVARFHYLEVTLHTCLLR